MPDVLFFAPTGVTEHRTTVFCDECSMGSALQGGSQVFVCSNILCPSGPRGRDLHASAGVTKVNVAREARKVAGRVVDWRKSLQAKLVQQPALSHLPGTARPASALPSSSANSTPRPTNTTTPLWT